MTSSVTQSSLGPSDRRSPWPPGDSEPSSGLRINDNACETEARQALVWGRRQVALAQDCHKHTGFGHVNFRAQASFSMDHWRQADISVPQFWIVGDKQKSHCPNFQQQAELCSVRIAHKQCPAQGRHQTSMIHSDQFPPRALRPSWTPSSPVPVFVGQHPRQKLEQKAESFLCQTVVGGNKEF